MKKYHRKCISNKPCNKCSLYNANRHGEPCDFYHFTSNYLFGKNSPVDQATYIDFLVELMARRLRV